MPALPIKHNVILCLSTKTVVCSPHHSEFAACLRKEINLDACFVEAESMRIVNATYEQDNSCCTAATIFSGQLRALLPLTLPNYTDQM